MNGWWPRTLFARTALLIASALAAFSAIAWTAIVWTTVIPSAQATADVLAQRITAAVAAIRIGAPLPNGVTVESGPPALRARRPFAFAFSFYVINLRRQLQADLPGADILVVRSVMPSEIWVRMPQLPDRWLALHWRIARPETPMAMAVIVLTGALLTLASAAVFARRLTSPLADLVAATARVAEGERVAIDTVSGPSEVRSLAAAFESMSHRLAELHEQRELMLAGLSHDLRSPLARVRVAIELLDPRDASLAEQMAAEVEEIDGIVGQFLQYVRAGYREAPVQTPVDDVIRNTLTRYVTDPQLRLELNATGPCMLPVEAMRHILLNLVQNAFEYGQPPVIVRSEFGPSELRLSIEDGGQGLSEPDWQEAVRPFQRLRATPGTGHTGLGLAMVDRLVRACAGTLTARRVDGGFVVAVTLPTAEVPARRIA